MSQIATENAQRNPSAFSALLSGSLWAKNLRIKNYLNSMMTLPQCPVEIQNAQVSDTRKDDSSNTVKYIIILSKLSTNKRFSKNTYQKTGAQPC